MSYTRFNATWYDWPDIRTPVTAAAMQHIEDGLANSLPLTGASLPTADPHVVGQLWSNAGVVTVSAG